VKWGSIRQSTAEEQKAGREESLDERFVRVKSRLNLAAPQAILRSALCSRRDSST
jgi:hypothetical protein